MLIVKKEVLVESCTISKRHLCMPRQNLPVRRARVFLNQVLVQQALAATDISSSCQFIPNSKLFTRKQNVNFPIMHPSV